MSGRHEDMMTAANDVICFGKAGRCQELFDRKVRKLDNWGSPVVDDGK
jgi:hypothetical protein